MVKFRLTTIVDIMVEDGSIEHRLDYMNSNNNWQFISYYKNKEDALQMAKDFSSVYKEEIFSI